MIQQACRYFVKACLSTDESWGFRNWVLFLKGQTGLYEHCGSVDIWRHLPEYPIKSLLLCPTWFPLPKLPFNLQISHGLCQSLKTLKESNPIWCRGRHHLKPKWSSVGKVPFWSVFLSSHHEAGLLSLPKPVISSVCFLANLKKIALSLALLI